MKNRDWGLGTRDPGKQARAALDRGLAEFGLDAALAEPLLLYLAQLEKWNRSYNLTAIRDPLDMVTKHLLDSLSVREFLPESRFPNPESRTLLDVASGAGLPGIPLAIASPGLAVTLLDGNGKKARFLRHVQRVLKLPNLAVVEARAENYQPEKPFDAVITRAFSSLGDFLALCARLCSLEGTLLAMKGRLDPEELSEIPPEVKLIETRKLVVPGLNEERHLVIAGLKL